MVLLDCLCKGLSIKQDALQQKVARGAATGRVICDIRGPTAEDNLTQGDGHGINERIASGKPGQERDCEIDSDHSVTKGFRPSYKLPQAPGMGQRQYLSQAGASVLLVQQTAQHFNGSLT